jgi:hypothetical protein
MTAIELFFFIALPTSVAFCFVFPLHDAFRLAFIIGSGSAVFSAASMFAFAGVFRLLRGRLPVGSAFTPWALLASGLAAGAAVVVVWHVHLALFGVVALAAVSMGVHGRGRWSFAGWWCLVGSVVVALLLHVILRTSKGA